MAFKVFYAWQSDRPNNVNRGFIHKALEAAASQLNAEFEIDNAVRDVQIDQDTQNVPGSPPIAETILQKIRDCNAFVADLTFVSGESAERKMPNPNVLIEYGYALHAVADAKIVTVFNEAFGSPTELPFDLQHRRWPITYTATPDGDSEEAQTARQSTRQQLARAIAEAIGAIIASFAEEETARIRPNPEVGGQSAPPHLPISISSNQSNLTESSLPQHTGFGSADGATTFQPSAIATGGTIRWERDVLGIRPGRDPANADYWVNIETGPRIVLALVPTSEIVSISNVSAIEIARADLEPLAGRRSSSHGLARNRSGPVVFSVLSDSDNTAWTATQLFTTGAMWGVDYYHVRSDKLMGQTQHPYIPTGAVEEILIDGFINYMHVASTRFSSVVQLEVIASLEGVGGYHLAVDPRQFDDEKYAGHIFENVIGYRTHVDRGADPFATLLPFFNRIYDAAGVVRPDVRTTGKSQR